jgi:chromosome segregation ATPase
MSNCRTQLHAVAEEHNRLFSLHQSSDNELEKNALRKKRNNNKSKRYKRIIINCQMKSAVWNRRLRTNSRISSRPKQKLPVCSSRLETTANEYQQELSRFRRVETKQLETAESLAVAEERLEQVTETQQHGQQQHSAWQQQWELYRTAFSAQNQQAEVQQAKINQLELHNRQLTARLEKLQQQQQSLTAAQAQLDCEALAEMLSDIEERARYCGDAVGRQSAAKFATAAGVKKFK